MPVESSDRRWLTPKGGWPTGGAAYPGAAVGVEARRMRWVYLGQRSGRRGLSGCPHLSSLRASVVVNSGTTPAEGPPFMHKDCKLGVPTDQEPKWENSGGGHHRRCQPTRIERQPRNGGTLRVDETNRRCPVAVARSGSPLAPVAGQRRKGDSATSVRRRPAVRS